MWLVRVRDQLQLQLQNSGPMDVLITGFVRGHRHPLEHHRPLDTGDHEVSELLRLAIEGEDMPAQAVVDQGERDGLAIRVPAGDGLVFDAEWAFLVDRPGHAG